MAGLCQESGHLYLAKDGHYYLALTHFVQAIFRCLAPG
jgi:hypothetical protein